MRRLRALAGPVADPGPGLRYASPAGRWTLAATVLGSGIAAIDATVVGIALPAIGRGFHVGIAALQWVVTAYLLALTGLLLLGGSLGDRYGRRRVFLVGTVWFAAASLVCALAPDAGTLIAGRALQGVGAALLMPGSLAILQGSFAPDDRATAIGAWSGLGGVATAVGPFLGGWLIGAASWRLVFVINLPVAAAVVAIASRHVPETRDPLPGRLDGAGAALAVAGLVGLTVGLIEGPGRHWGSPMVVTALTAGAALLAAFAVVEHRSDHPMLPLPVFRSRQFAAANAVTFVVYAALGGVLFLLPTVLQEVTGYSPLLAGTALLPVTLIMLATSARSGALAARIGPRLQMTVGPLVIAAGLVLLTRIVAGAGYLAVVLPAMVVFGLGLAINVAPLTATALAAAPAEHAGVASAVNNDVARAGGLVAVAVLPAVAGITGEAYLHPAVLAAGFHTAVLVAAGICAAGGVLAGVTIRNPVREPGRPLRAAGEPAEAAAPAPRQPSHCALDGPPVEVVTARPKLPPAAGTTTTIRSR